MSTVNFYAGFILGECIDYAIGHKTRALTSSWAQFRTWGWISRFRKEIRFGWSLRHTTELKLRTHARPRLGREPVRTTEPWPGKSRVEAIRIHTGELASDCKLVGSRIIPICAYIWIYKYSYWSVSFRLLSPAIINFYWTEVCWLTEWLTWIESLFL